MSQKEKDKSSKEKQKIYSLTENEREEYIYSASNASLIDFAKDLQLKVMHAIGQRPVATAEDAELAEKKYLGAIEVKQLASKQIDENYSIEVELCDMARTVFIAARWKLVVKALGGKRRVQVYEPHYYIDRLYKLFELVTKISEKIFFAQQKKLPKEYINTLEVCYEQVITKYFDFFLEGIGRALENQDTLTVSRLRIVCSLHAGLVDGKQHAKGKKIPHLANEAKIIDILNECIKTMEKRIGS